MAFSKCAPTGCSSQSRVNGYVSFSKPSISSSAQLELDKMRGMKFYDILLIYHTSDSGLAREYKHYLQTLKVSSGRSIDVLLCEEIPAGTLRFQAYSWFITDCCTYTFLLLTKEFCQERVHQILSETVLINSLEDADRCWSVVPVFSGPKSKKDIKVPFILSALRGLDLLSRDNFAMENMQTLIDTRVYIRDKRERVLQNQVDELEKQVEREENIRRLEQNAAELKTKREYEQLLKSRENHYKNNVNNNAMDDSMKHYLQSDIPENVLQPKNKTVGYNEKNCAIRTLLQTNQNSTFSCRLSSNNMSSSLNNSINDDECSLSRDKLRGSVCDSSNVNMCNQTSPTHIHHLMPSKVDDSDKTLHDAYDTITTPSSLNENPNVNDSRTACLRTPTDICSKASQSIGALENLGPSLREYVNVDLIHAQLRKTHTDPDIRSSSFTENNNHLSGVTKTDAKQAPVLTSHLLPDFDEILSRDPLESQTEIDASGYHSCAEWNASWPIGKVSNDLSSSEMSKSSLSQERQVHHYHHYYHHLPGEDVHEGGSQREASAGSSKPQAEESEEHETNKQVFILKNSSLHIGSKTVIMPAKKSDDIDLEDDDDDEADADSADPEDKEAESHSSNYDSASAEIHVDVKENDIGESSKEIEPPDASDSTTDYARVARSKKALSKKKSCVIS